MILVPDGSHAENILLLKGEFHEICMPFKNRLKGNVHYMSSTEHSKMVKTSRGPFSDPALSPNGPKKQWIAKSRETLPLKMVKRDGPLNRSSMENGDMQKAEKRNFNLLYSRIKLPVIRVVLEQKTTKRQ